MKPRTLRRREGDGLPRTTKLASRPQADGFIEDTPAEVRVGGERPRPQGPGADRTPALVAYAVKALKAPKAKPRTPVHLDAGNVLWWPVGDTARRLLDAGGTIDPEHGTVDPPAGTWGPDQVHGLARNAAPRPAFNRREPAPPTATVQAVDGGGGRH
ncbi:hypothetical protein ACF1CG_21435 [Streptomyces sp. NPDC014773]|uniref:hypothetical protein n=1 Tax=Streptomyces sp. NPDC014773 TaxID=3364908 RepID=UPI0036F7DE0C